MAGASLRRTAPQVATAQMLDSYSGARFKWAPALGHGGRIGAGQGLGPCPSSLGLALEALEAPVEAGELTAGVKQALLAAGPGRMRFRVDFEAQRVAGLAVGRARRVGAAVGHHDGDLVIIRVNAFLHRANPWEMRAKRSGI